MTAPLMARVMSPGNRLRVAGFEKGDREYRHRLLSMGLTPGVEFTVTRVAPMGDPIEINLRGFALSLRQSEAAHVRLECV